MAAGVTPTEPAVTVSQDNGSLWNRSGSDPGKMEMETMSDVECRLFLLVTYVLVFGVMCVFGLIGNTLSFLVLRWEKQSMSATFLLQMMALADNLFLLATGFAQIVSVLTLLEQFEANPLMPYMPSYAWPFVHITQMGTVWITVLIALNRYIAICRPFQASKLCTLSRAKLQVIVMVVFVLLYNIPRFLEYRVVHKTDPETNQTQAATDETSLKTSQLYNYLYETFLYCLFVFLGPLVILIVLNTCLVRELWAARQRLIKRHLPVAGEEEENNLTLVMIVIILIFLVCQAPAFLNQLLYFGIPHGYVCGHAYYYFYHISNLLVSANSSVNFIVYCAFRKQFRQRLKAFCRRQRSTSAYVNSYPQDNGKDKMYASNTRVETLVFTNQPPEHVWRHA